MIKLILRFQYLALTQVYLLFIKLKFFRTYIFHEKIFCLAICFFEVVNNALNTLLYSEQDSGKIFTGRDCLCEKKFFRELQLAVFLRKKSQTNKLVFVIVIT